MHAKSTHPVPDPARDQPKDRIAGTVVRITFQNPKNDYRVVKVVPDGAVDRSRLDKRGEVVLVGALPGIEVGEGIEAEGQWESHPRHGPQFKADWFKPSLPTGRRGIEAYLRSGAIKGVGEVIARRITDAFGEKTFEVLDHEIERLSRVKGVTRNRLESIRVSWAHARGDRELITFLGEHGISPAWAHRLRKAYGDGALSILRANPYRLAAEVRGIGFHRADVMARRIGLATDAPERIDAALGHVLETQAGEGHTFLARDRLLELATELLGLDLQEIETRLDLMLMDRRLTGEEIAGVHAIFLNPLQEAEIQCAFYLTELFKTPRRAPRIDAEQFLDRFEQRARIRLAPGQRGAVLSLAREGLLILTGGPGTGKTTALRAVIELFRAGGRAVRLAAPTGRAARRLSETTKAPAETIHRLLGFQAHTGHFLYDASNTIEADLVVIDEVSMLDVLLARDLFSALRPGTCLLLVGDEDQLPSVGPGNVLGDLIGSNLFPVTRLTEIFRQAESSMIVSNAHRINQGLLPSLDGPGEGAEQDFFFIERKDPAEVMDAIKTMVGTRIGPKFHLEPIRDIQVLTPMRRGELGVEAINRALQSVLNGGEREGDIPLDADDENRSQLPKLRVGDRVMQTVNQYDKDNFNGDIGRVQKIDAESGEIMVLFDDRTVSYLADEAKQLTLAYAVTIHKSQGSEYPAVVIPLHMQHYVMLQRNLLYTALTRGKRLVCIIGMKTALGRAVRNSRRRRRNSALGFYLAGRAGNLTALAKREADLSPHA